MRAKILLAGVAIASMAIAPRPNHAAGGPLVAKLTGTAVITRAGSGATEPARPGSRLGPGDSIQAGADSSVSLVDDGKVQTLASGAGFRVPDSGEDRLFMQSVMGRLAGVATDPSDPAVSDALRAVKGTVALLGPIDSMVPTPLPAFRWSPTTGAASYDVHVRDSLGTVLLKKTVADSRLDPIAEGFRPQPRVRYTWVVIPSAGFAVGGKPPSPSEAWFELLAPEDARALDSRLAQVDRAMRDKEPPAKRLVAQALVYEQSKCYDRSRELLAAAAAVDPAGEWGRVARRRLSGH